MKKILVILLGALLSSAFSVNASAQKNADAKKVLDATAKKLTSMKNVKATFTLSEGGSSTAGTFYVSGSKYKIVTPNYITWYDGKTQWVYVKRNEEVNVSTPTKAERAAANPYSFVELYKSGYNYSLKKNGKNYEVHLTAESKTAGIKEVKVSISSDYKPTAVSFRQGNTWVKINITSLAGNQKFSKSTFTFPQAEYKKAEIIDLR